MHAQTHQDRLSAVSAPDRGAKWFLVAASGLDSERQPDRECPLGDKPEAWVPADGEPVCAWDGLPRQPVITYGPAHQIDENREKALARVTEALLGIACRTAATISGAPTPSRP